RNTLLERFGQTGDSHQAYAVFATWSLGSGPTDDLKRVLALADSAVQGSPARGSYLNGLGAIYYRLGEYQKAITTLEAAITANNGQDNAWDSLVLAMAHFCLGHMQDARKWLNKGTAWLEFAANQKIGERGQVHYGNWSQRQHLAIHLCEAKAL